MSEKFITSEDAREIARELLRQFGHAQPGEAGGAGLLHQLNENVQGLRLELRAGLETVALLKQVSARHSSTLEDHEDRLTSAEEEIAAAGLEDIAGVRRWIFKLGIIALVAMTGLLSAALLFFPKLADALKRMG